MVEKSTVRKCTTLPYCSKLSFHVLFALVFQSTIVILRHYTTMVDNMILPININTYTIRLYVEAFKNE